MTNTSTPEWRHFHANVQAAFEGGLISDGQLHLLRYVESPLEGEDTLARCKREYGEFRLMRDIWQAERDSKNRRWIVVGCFAASLLIVLIALYFSSQP